MSGKAAGMERATSATVSSWAHSAKLTEFQRLKDTVKKLESTSRDQLLLERESQNVFDFLKAEQTRIKRSIGALSSVIDEELAVLRNECSSLRGETTKCLEAARQQADSAVSLVGESRQRDTEWLQLTFAQVKESITKLEIDLKESRSQLFELSSSQSSAVARITADAESSTTSVARQLSQLSERLSTTEARCNALHDGGVRQEHDELVRWMRDAKQQLAGVKAIETAQGLRDSSVTVLQHKQDEASQQLAASNIELARLRDAIVLMVETVDTLSRDSKAAYEGLSARVAEFVDVSEQRSRMHEKALTSLASEGDSAREGLRSLERRIATLEESVDAAKAATTTQTEWSRAADKELQDLKQEASHSGALLRSLKTGQSEAAESLSAHRAQMRKAVDEIERRHEGYNRATALFAEMLKVTNPLALAAPPHPKIDTNGLPYFREPPSMTDAGGLPYFGSASAVDFNRHKS